MTVAVLLTAYAANPSLSGGGPAWTALHLTKKGYEEVHPYYAWAAVFVDRIIRNLDNLDMSSGAVQPRRFAGLPLIHYLAPTAGYAWRLKRTFGSLYSKGPVVIHPHDVMSAYLARRVLGTSPQILTIHTIGSWVTQGFLLHRPHLHGSWVEKFLRHVERDAIQRAKIVVFTSKGAAQSFEADYPGILKTRDVRIVYTGVEVEEIARHPVDHNLRIQYGGEGKRLLLSIAPHIREKGLHILIEAVAALPLAVRKQIAVLIVGRGPGTKELDSLVREKGLMDTVKLVVEWVPDVISLMKLSDAFILPPMKTVLDLVFLEAMAARLPVITTAVGGNLELFDNASAILVPPGDPVALREAIVKLLDDNVLRDSLAENAFRRVLRDFTLSRMMEGYLSLYGELATHSGFVHYSQRVR